MNTQTLIGTLAIFFLTIAGCTESKGENMALKIRDPHVRTDEKSVTVMFSAFAAEDVTGAKVRKFEMGGAQLLEPPVLPFDLGRDGDGDGTIRKQAFRIVAPKFDAKALQPGKTYDLVVETEYRVNGKTHIDTQHLSVIIPAVMSAPDRVAQQGFARGRSSMEPAPGQVAKEDQPTKVNRHLKADIKVAMKDKKGATEYDYTITNNNDESVITSIHLSIPSPITVTGTPKGWKEINKNEGKGMGWLTTADNGIRPGKSMKFQVTGGPNQTNVGYMLMGSGLMTGGLTIGPGK